MPSITSQAIPLLIAALLLAACGTTHQVRGEPPLVGLEGLSHDNGDILLDISIRNVNDTRFDIAGLGLHLELDGQLVGDPVSDPGRLSISPRGREVVRVPARVSAQTLQQLARLSNGEQTSLPWRLEVRFDSTERGAIPTEARGFLHAVPGQPNRFR